MLHVQSVMKTTSLESMATPDGFVKRALVPWPPAQPVIALPAIVETTPAGVIIRIRMPV